MKRILLFAITFTLACSLLYATDPVYKQVQVDGEKVWRWVMESRIEYEYDENGNETHRTMPDGFEIVYEYDASGLLIHSKAEYGSDYALGKNTDSAVAHLVSIVNPSNRQTLSKTVKAGDSTKAYEYWYEYDNQGRPVHVKRSDGDEKWLTYDENGKNNYTNYATGLKVWYEYDANGNLIHTKESSGYESWMQYDENGYGTLFHDNEGYYEFYTFDDKGNLTSLSDTTGYYIWSEYNEDNKEIHSWTFDGDEWWYEYEYYPGTDLVKTRIRYTRY